VTRVALKESIAPEHFIASPDIYSRVNPAKRRKGKIPACLRRCRMTGVECRLNSTDSFRAIQKSSRPQKNQRRMYDCEARPCNPQGKAPKGAKGGRKGARVRASRLTPEQKSDIARIAAEARWKKKQS